MASCTLPICRQNRPSSAYRIATVGLRGVLLDEDALLDLGELVMATPAAGRLIDLSESDMQGSLNPLVTVLLFCPPAAKLCAS